MSSRGVPRLAVVFLGIVSLVANPTAIGQANTPSGEKTVPKFVEGAGYVFVSGQGPKRADDSVPGNFKDQARQTIENIKTVLQGAGLSDEHLVYLQVYLEDVKHVGELDEVFASAFVKDPPARAVLGVAKVPDGAIQINAIAVRDLEGKKAVAVAGRDTRKAFSAGMLTHDQLFVSTKEIFIVLTPIHIQGT